MTPGLPDIGGRADGFRDAMTQAGAKVLDYVYPGTDQALAADAVTAAINANPDLNGVYATHETAANGAASAIKAAGQQGKIKLVAFDSAPNQVADLKAGVYDGLIAQAPFNMGYYSVKLVAQVIRGKVDTKTVQHDARPSCSPSPRRTPTAPRRSRGSTRPTSTTARRSRSAADPDPRPTTMPRHQRRGIVIPWPTPQLGERAERMRR